MPLGAAKPASFLVVLVPVWVSEGLASRWVMSCLNGVWFCNAQPPFGSDGQMFRFFSHQHRGNRGI